MSLNEKPAKRPCTRSEAKRLELLPAHCPICLESDEGTLLSLVSADGCEKHPCCLPCYERILLPDNNDVPDCLCVNCTNSGLEGKCPVCQTEISLFGLKYCCNGKPVGEANVLQTPLVGRVFREKKIKNDDDDDDDDDDNNNNNNNSNADADELLERLTFPSHPGDPVEYYTTGSSAYANHPQTLPLRHTQFHAASRCFFGVHKFSYQANPRFQAVAVTVMFSFDYSFITRGRILWMRREFDSDEEFQSAYPVDGLWEVTSLHKDNNNNNDSDDDDNNNNTGLYDTPLTTTKTTFRVKDGFRFCPSGHCTGPFHAMPNEGIIAVFYNDEPERILWNFEDAPAGPKVGEILPEEFVSTPPPHGAIKVSWKRIKGPSKTDYGTPVIAFGGDSNVIFQQYCPDPVESAKKKMHLHHYHMQPILPSHSHDSLWGNTFVDDRLRICGTSLHFVSPTESYIDWGMDPLFVIRLACGVLDAPFPLRVPIQDISFTGPRTLVGSIYWLQELGRPLKNTSKWTFTFQFDSKYMCVDIISIKVVSWQFYTPFHACSFFRQSFCNAALFDTFRQAKEEQEMLSSFDALNYRLHDEGIHEGSIELVHKVWEIAQKRNPSNPVTFWLFDGKGPF